MDWITDEAALGAMYGAPSGPALAKEVARLTPAHRRLVEASPFFVLASSGPEGLDCSPRGDAPCFVIKTRSRFRIRNLERLVSEDAI